MKPITTGSGLNQPPLPPEPLGDGPPCDPAASPFLGVSRSVCGRFWCLRPRDDRLSLALGQRYGLSDTVAGVLAARRVGIDEAPFFLDPKLSHALPDPSLLLDMDRAVERLARAVVEGMGVGVFADYDVDGATSAALLVRYFRALGVPVSCHIPDRLEEGYGPNPEALRNLAAKSGGLVVTVDCGTTAHETLAAARADGIEVVVIDHHAGEAQLPPAVAVVNPNRIDETSAHRQLAAVGVTFLVLVGLNRRLRQIGHFASRPEPDLKQWLDLVALGTVCDVVPLVGVNRALVAQGLKVCAMRRNLGLRALADVSRMTEEPSCYTLGFVLGPRINAGGRVGKANLGMRLLVSEDEREAREIALQLDAFNRDRQMIEAQVLEECCRRLEDGADAAAGPVIVIGGDGWHPGVIGIVASRLRERFNRPALVVSLDGDEGVGSGRSVAGIDLGSLILAARQSGLLNRGGGHAMAAGFSVTRGGIDGLREFLSSRVAARLLSAGFRADLEVDGAIRIAGITEEVLAGLDRVGPFGAGNAEPVFAIPDVRVQWAEVVGERHVRCMLTDAAGARLEAVAFRAAENGLGTFLLGARDVVCHVVGRPRVKTWRGVRSIQLHIDDAAPAWGGT